MTIRVETAGEVYDLTVDGRPVGPTYVRYEDKYRTGDTPQAVIDRVTNRQVLTLPAGRFEMADYAQGYNACFNVPPKTCGGLVGVGPGGLGRDEGTVLAMKPGSSTKGALVPAQGANATSSGKSTNPLGVLKCLDAPGPMEFRRFHVECTDQGADYHGNHTGFQVFNSQVSTWTEDVLVTGWQGDAGAPPGEVAGYAVHGPGRHTARRVEVDGRRAVGGPALASMGMTAQNSNGSVWEDCTATHCRAAGFVSWQSTNGRATRLRVDSLTDVPKDRWIGNGGINSERSAGWVFEHPNITGRPNKVHITHSNDHWTLSWPGITGMYPVDNGALTIIDPTFNDLWGNGWLYLQSWVPYGVGDITQGGNSMLFPSGAPKVYRTDGKTTTYNWVLGSGHQLTSEQMAAGARLTSRRLDPAGLRELVSAAGAKGSLL